MTRGLDAGGGTGAESGGGAEGGSGLWPGAPAAGARLVGLGIDLVEVPRFGAVLARRPAMVDRLFTPGERAYAQALADPVPSLAARFAAKEAVMKALGVGIGAFRFVDVDVQRQASGAPVVVLSGRASSLAAERGAHGWAVSLTHTASVAAAVVVALG